MRFTLEYYWIQLQPGNVSYEAYVSALVLIFSRVAYDYKQYIQESCT